MIEESEDVLLSGEDILPIVSEYRRRVRAELQVRISAWDFSLDRQEKFEVIGALTARQVSLATQFASAGANWTAHVAPLFLRSMVDAFITMAWISVDPLTRSILYINYGLGQLKLAIEHRSRQLDSDGNDPNIDAGVIAMRQRLNSQRYEGVVDVNVGSWSGIGVREMAVQAGCIDLYNYAYGIYSGCVHSNWDHTSRFNLIQTPQPLHRYISLPHDPDLYLEPRYLITAAKYADKALILSQEACGTKESKSRKFESSYLWVRTEMNELSPKEATKDDSETTEQME